MFATSSGDPLDYHSMTGRTIEPAAKQAGLPAITMHVLRHTFASLLIASGANVKWVQAQMGHTKAAMTLDTYAELWEQGGQAERVASMIDERFGQSIGTASASSRD